MDPVTSQPDIPEIASAVPPGTNPVPPKPTKAVSKTYSVTDDRDNKPVFEGIRTLEDVRKLTKTLATGEYTLRAAFTKKIIVSDVRRVKGV